MRVNHRLASPERRLFAFLLDILLLYTSITWLLYNFFELNKIFDLNQEFRIILRPEKMWLSIKYMTIIKIIIWTIYNIIMEASRLQGTMGKIILGIIVIDENCIRITPKTSILRNSVKILSYILQPFAYFWLHHDEKYQCWHDKISRTYVVKKIDE